MNLVLFTHPNFLVSTSMPRYAQMILGGMQSRGHTVQVWAPKPCLYLIPCPTFIKKWLGYFDQYIIFPIAIKKRLARQRVDTLFVFCDQALGPWVPYVKSRPHVVHCHDFLALKAALGEIPDISVSWTGRKYQKLIQKGFSQAQNFISVSKKTEKDLIRFLAKPPKNSVVIYNGLSPIFEPLDLRPRIKELNSLNVDVPQKGMILHVGGNQWYKNRDGVLEIYRAYVEMTPNPLPLWMIGPPPTESMKKLRETIGPLGEVQYLPSVNDRQLQAAYSHARLLLFPSLGEGFGWPIIEAMACGCPVVTTGEVPMSEVGGDVAFYLDKRKSSDPINWAIASADKINQILELDSQAMNSRINLGLHWASKFGTDQVIESYEGFYSNVLTEQAKR